MVGSAFFLAVAAAAAWPAALVTLSNNQGVSCGGASIPGPGGSTWVVTTSHCLKADVAQTGALENRASARLLGTKTLVMLGKDLGFFEIGLEASSAFETAQVADGAKVTIWPARSRIPRKGRVIGSARCLAMAQEYCPTSGLEQGQCAPEQFRCAEFDLGQVPSNCAAAGALTCDGDSGSPLTNTAGKLVGIHSGSSKGVSFFQTPQDPYESVKAKCNRIEGCAGKLPRGMASNGDLHLLDARIRDLEIELEALREQKKLLSVQ